jgi:diguanylate cyclase (GGDEF)-like protein
LLPAFFAYSDSPISPTSLLKNDIKIFVLGFAVANSFTLRPMQPVLIGCVGAISQIGYYFFVIDRYGPLQVTDSWAAVVETPAIHLGGFLFNGLILIPAICVLLGVIVKRGRDNIVRAASLERDAAKLERAANCDPLTGLLNRRAIREHLENQIERHATNRYPLAILLCDLDHFKQINDTYGHDMGDQVLRSVAHRLQDSLRELDLLARWGGEEFLVLLPDTDLQGGAVVAEKIRKRLADEPFQAGNAELSLSLSIGMSAYAAGQSVETCIKTADGALYQAKHRGRNRVVVAELAEPVGT